MTLNVFYVEWYQGWGDRWEILGIATSQRRAKAMCRLHAMTERQPITEWTGSAETDEHMIADSDWYMYHIQRLPLDTMFISNQEAQQADNPRAAITTAGDGVG